MVTVVCICQCPRLLVCHARFFMAGKRLSLQITEVFDGTSVYNHCSCGWQLQSNSLHADLGSKSSWSLHTTHTYVHLITFSCKRIKNRHVFVKHWCPRRQQSQNMAKISVLQFGPAQPPGACDVSEVWGTHRWTYSLSLVTVSSSKL